MILKPFTQSDLVYLEILGDKLPNCRMRECEFNKSDKCWNTKCYWWYKQEGWQWFLCDYGVFGLVHDTGKRR